ncbi:MAG: hypothetical protein IJR46_01395 [Neisseriaceae bacterium]|nr:hypothetical protein [Neisseriaceae bacterium]
MRAVKRRGNLLTTKNKLNISGCLKENIDVNQKRFAKVSGCLKKQYNSHH